MAKVMPRGWSPAVPRQLWGVKVQPRERRWLGQQAIAATVKAPSAPMHPRKATKSKKKSTQADAAATTQKPSCRELGNFYAAARTNWPMQSDRAGDGKVNSPQ
jgi:hypothetical protein